MSELPRGWAEARLTEVIDLHDSRRIPLNKEQRQQRQGPYPYYGANGLVDHVDGYLFDGSYVLLAEDGGYFDDSARGVAYEATGKFWVNNHAHILSPRGPIPNRFLTHLLNSIEWLPYVGGSTRLKLTQAAMQQIPVSVPPLPEQRRIVAKLDSLRARSARARQELDHIPKLIERYKQAILAKAFSGVLTVDWKSSSIEDVVTEGLVGLVRSVTQQHDECGTPYIRMNHFDLWGEWNDEKLTRVETSAEEFERYELRAGDVLFNTRNSYELVGKVAIWPDGRPGFVYNNNLLRLRFRPELDARFAAYYMISPPFRAYLDSVKSATTSVCAIYQRSLMAGSIPVPPMEQQKAVVRLIENALAWLDKIAIEYARAEQLLPKLDQAILAKAFRGELVPQDPNDEPASALLELIKAEREGSEQPKRRRVKK